MASPRWLDLKVSLGNIITIALLLLGISTGWSELRAKDRSHDDSIAALKSELVEIKANSSTTLEKIVDRSQTTSERVVRVETKVDEILSRLPTLKTRQD